MSFVEIKGNLFESLDSLAHCVGSDFIIGLELLLNLSDNLDVRKNYKKCMYQLEIL